MDSPQLENGYVKIANEIIEALAKIRIPGECCQVLWVIFRKTYGWNKKEDMISFSQISEATGIKRPHVSRAISKLIDMRVVTKNGNSGINKYRFNKVYGEWQALPKKVTDLKVLPKKVTGVTNNGNKGVTNNGKYKRQHKDTITKDIYTHPLQKYIFDNPEFMNIRKLKRQITEKECKRIEEKYHQQEIKNILRSMENYKKLTTNYVSVGLTLEKWLEREYGSAKKSF